MGKDILISVVIPAFNEASLIQQTIQRIQHAFGRQEDLKWELIVSDNNSTDNTASMAAEAGAVVVFEPNNQISRARNTGARKATGKWLLFIDADTYPSPELVDDMLEVMREDAYVGCGTTITVEGGTLFNKLRMERLNPFFRLFKLCGGAFLLCSKEAYEAVNGFSTRLYAYEEIDFVIRLKRYGRTQGKTFKILHQNPPITSGRKGEYNLIALVKLFTSNLAAVVLFILHYLLPGPWIERLGARLLGYWYDEGR